MDRERELDALLFSDIARLAFAGLVELGMQPQEVEPFEVRYASENMELSVSQEWPSRELSIVAVRRPPDEFVQYSLGEILREFHPSSTLQQSVTTRRADVALRFLRGVAEELLTSCRPFLLGNREAVQRLQSRCSRERQERTHRAMYGPLLRDGDLAWQSKDRAKARSCYEGAEPILDAVRKRRLELLRKG